MPPLVKPNGSELRTFVFDEYEIRASQPNADGTIPFKGHAAVFNRKATIAGMWTESFDPGAFKRTIGQADIRMLMNHDPAMPLARSKSGSLRLSEDSKGLAVDADMTPTSYANDLALLMESRVVTEMSVGFSSVRETWDESPKIPDRTIQEARLYDVSPVTFPAYPGTDASLRSVQYGNLLRALGIEDMDAEQRDAFVAAISLGDVAPEYREQLLTMQARVASLVSTPGETPPSSESESRGKDHDETRKISVDTLRRRHHLTAMRLGER